MNSRPETEQNSLVEHQVQSEDIWYEFFNRCIQICAENIDYLVREKDQEMMVRERSNFAQTSDSLNDQTSALVG